MMKLLTFFFIILTFFHLLISVKIENNFGYSELTDFVVDLKLNIGFTQSLSGLKFYQELSQLIIEMKRLEDLVLSQKVLFNYCGNCGFRKYDLGGLVLNKYQMDVFNPWAERINYKILDENVIGIQNLKSMNAEKILSHPDFEKRFTNACNRGIQAFKCTYKSSIQYQKVLHNTLLKHFIKKVEPFVRAHKIYLNSKNLGFRIKSFDDVLNIYIELQRIIQI